MGKKPKGTKGAQRITYKKVAKERGEVTLRQAKKEGFVQYQVRIDLLSPLHLGSGAGDVNMDMDVSHDSVGIPYFPAKRFKGLLYESALEITEMAEISDGFISRRTVEELFRHAAGADVQLVIHDFHLETEDEYEKMRGSWRYLEEKYPDIVSPSKVLGLYSKMRYFTSIDAKTGVANPHSLHNMRVVEKTMRNGGEIFFTGCVEIRNAATEHQRLFLLALSNLRRAGLKRNRGMGRIRCSVNGKRIPILKLLEGEA